MTRRKLFGQRVKELRIAAGMSQEAFTDRCGFAHSYMSRIERSRSNASLDAIEVLANALSVEPWQLLVSDSSEDNDPELLVPYAADGSCFHPGLASTRDGSFGVGDKAAQKRFVSFSRGSLMPHVEMTLQGINRFMVIFVPANEMQALSPSDSRFLGDIRAS